MSNWRQGQQSRQKSREWARDQGRGVPVPGTGVTHGHRSHNGKRNAAGALEGNLEWGGKARKQEADQRGLNNKARRQAIADQDFSDSYEFGDPRPYDQDADMLDDALVVGLSPGVTFNGHDYNHPDWDDYYDEDYR